MNIGARELIVFAVLLAMLGGAWQFGFKRIQAERDELTQAIEQKQSAIQRVQATNSNVLELEAKIESLSESIAYFDAKLPREKDIQSILENAWKIAEKNGLTASKVRTLKIEQGPSHFEQPIEISINGNFPGFYSFLLEMEQLARITRVNKMSLNKMSETNGQMTAQLTMSIFFAPDDRLTASAQ